MSETSSALDALDAMADLVSMSTGIKRMLMGQGWTAEGAERMAAHLIAMVDSAIRHQ